ncbi:hypothetical protein ANRL1_03942 [Anaerolineae bacterium]|nr:hypothetical protein ANRL1_03942 [Anaerolineae bacterium]
MNLGSSGSSGSKTGLPTSKALFGFVQSKIADEKVRQPCHPMDVTFRALEHILYEIR